MHGLLYEVVETVEDDVDVSRERGLVEDGVEVDVNLGIGADELPEVGLLVRGAHGVALDDPVRLVALQPGLDEREQEPVTEEEVLARLEVPSHSLGIDDETVDDPREPVE